MKILRRILLWTALGLGLLAALAVFLLLAFRNNLAGWGLTQIFKTQVEVGQTSLGWSGKERMFQIWLSDVNVKGTHADNRAPVFRIQRASVNLNLKKLWKGIYRQDTSKVVFIPDVHASNCQIHFLIDSLGRRNFRGLFKGRRPREKRPELILLERLQASNVSFVYEDLGQKRRYQYWMPESEVRVAIARDSIDFDGRTGGFSRLMRIAGYAFLEQTPFQAEARLTLHKADKRLVLRPGTQLTLDSTRIALGGKLFVTSPAAYDLFIEAPEGRIQTLLNLLPHASRDFLHGYELEGNLTLQGRLRGLDLKRRHPRLDLAFRCSDVSFRNRKTSISLENLQLAGRYTNGSARNITTTALFIDSLTASLGRHRLQASGSVFDFRKLLLEGKAEASAELTDLLGWIGQDDHHQAQGRLEANLSFGGSLRATEKMPVWKAMSYQGRLRLHDLGHPGLMGAANIERLNGEVFIRDSLLDMPQLTGLINGAALRFKMRSTGMVGRFIDGKEPLHLDLEGRIDGLSINSLLSRNDEGPALSGKLMKAPQQAGSSLAANLRQRLPADLTGEARLTLNQPKLGRQTFRHIASKVSLRRNEWRLDTLEIVGTQERVNGRAAIVDGPRLSRDVTLEVDYSARSLLTLLNETELGRFKPGMPRIETNGRLSGHLRFDAGGERMQFRLERAAVRLPERNVHLTELSARVTLDGRHLRDFRAAPLLVDSVEGRANEYPFTARARVQDWKSQQTDLFVNTEIGADVLLNYFRIDNIDRPYGRFRIATQLSGPLDRFLKPEELLKLEYNGRMEIDGLGFRFVETGLLCRDVTARIDYNRRHVSIRSLEGRLGRSRFRMSARMQNALDYIYTKSATLNADAWFQCDTLDIQELLTRPSGRRNSERANPYEFSLPRNLNVKARAQVKRATFDQLACENANLNLRVQDQHAWIDEGRFDIFGGHVRLDASLAPSGADSLRVGARIFANQLDIAEALQGFGDFGQTFITHEQISGRFDGQLLITDRMPRTFGYHFEHTKISLNFQISDGVLTDFLPIRLLEPLLRTDRQRSRPFMMTGRNLRFENRTLHVPWLELRTLLFDVLVRGNHHADGVLNYHMRAVKGRRRVSLKKQHKHLLPGQRRYDESLLAFRLHGRNDGLHLDYDPGPLRDHVLRKTLPQGLLYR